MIQEFFNTIEAKNRSKGTVVSLKQALSKAESSIGRLENASYEDILKFLQQLRKEGMSESSIFLIESKLIQFYKFCFRQTDNVQYNKLAERIKDLKTKPRYYLNPADILLPEDIKRLINVATLERDRCIVASLFESGMRIGEIQVLTNSMIRMDESKQEVTFNIPNLEGCKSGSRSIVCVEIYGYVQDWMKCNTSDRFMPLTIDGIRKAIARLFNRAGIKKPCNPHMFRHSAITHAVNLGMQQNAISERFWGIPNSNMLSVYVHLSEQMQADAYKNAKGMNGNGTKIINPLAVRCVVCGRLIQAGELCVTCKENKDLKERMARLEMNAGIFDEDMVKAMIEKRVKEILERG